MYKFAFLGGGGYTLDWCFKLLWTVFTFTFVIHWKSQQIMNTILNAAF